MFHWHVNANENKAFLDHLIVSFRYSLATTTQSFVCLSADAIFLYSLSWHRYYFSVSAILLELFLICIFFFFLRQQISSIVEVGKPKKFLLIFLRKRKLFSRRRTWTFWAYLRVTWLDDTCKSSSVYQSWSQFQFDSDFFRRLSRWRISPKLIAISFYTSD